MSRVIATLIIILIIAIIVLLTVLTGRKSGGESAEPASSEAMARRFLYSPITPSENDKIVCIVFDDGWRSQLSGIPILDKYDFKITFAIVTSWIDQDGSSFLSWEEILDLQKQGHDIVSHSYSHKDITKVSLETLIAELRSSKEALQARGIYTEAFVYPYGTGYNNETVRSQLSKYYLLARSIHSGYVDIRNVDSYDIPSYAILRTTTLREFASYVDGAHGNLISLIVYHSIGGGDQYSVSLEQFEEQMTYLKNNNFKVMTLSQIFLKKNY
ncbi:MAG: polysaccharide deacetylase family protein [Thermoproteota archaeon]